MKIRLKRTLALLLAFVLTLSLAPTAALAAGDVSGDINVTDVEIKLNNSENAAYSITDGDPVEIEAEEHTLPSNQTISVTVNVGFEHAGSGELSEGDTFTIELFSVESAYAGKVSMSVASGVMLQYGNVELITEETGGRTVYKLKVTLTESITDTEKLTGNLSSTGFISGLAKGEQMTLQRVDKDGLFATIHGADTSGFNFYGPSEQENYKNYSWHWNSTPARIQWKIAYQYEVPTQFEDYHAALEGGEAGSKIQSDMIFVDTLDENMTFTDPIKGGLNLTLTFHAYLYDSELVEDWTKVEDQEDKLIHIYRDHDGNDGFEFPNIAVTVDLATTTLLTYVPSESAPGGAEAYVRANAKTWTIVEKDGCEQLIINFGTPGDDGLTYADVFNDDTITALLDGFDKELEHIEEVLEDYAGDNGNDTIADPLSGQIMSRWQWQEFKRIFQESKEYWAKESLSKRYVYSFEGLLNVAVRYDSEANRYDEGAFNAASVKNTFSAEYTKEGENIENSYSGTCNNFWRNGLAAKAKDGDIVLFKADSAADNDQPGAWNPGNESSVPVIDSPLEGATFRVYDSETGGSPLSFTRTSDGTYQLSADGEVTELSTDQTGAIVITGLSNGSTYWFEETEAPEGYYKVTERHGATSTSGKVTPVLVENTRRGVEISKVDSEDNTPLAGAEFELTKDGGKITGFSRETIGGKVCLVYDGTGCESIVTGSDGRVTVLGLPAGSYALTETEAPEGYLEPEDAVEFTLTEDMPAGSENVVNGTVMLTIENTAEPDTYTITVNVVNGTAEAEGLGEGTVSGEKVTWTLTVEAGADAEIAFTPSEGYELESVTVDGDDDAELTDGAYTFSNVGANREITVTYVKTYSVKYELDGELPEGAAPPVDDEKYKEALKSPLPIRPRACPDTGSKAGSSTILSTMAETSLICPTATSRSPAPGSNFP